MITGVSGGEFSIRGRVQAYDAKTGKHVWRFYTVPGPGEIGHDTWPANNDAWQHGGAPVWQTPAVDPELGLLYFSTGNASPDLDGAERAGDNLFAASIVALDAKTGQVPLALPAGAPRHLGLRRPEPGRAVRRRGRRRAAPGASREAEQDRLGLHARPRDRQAALSRSRRSRCRRPPSQKTAKTQPIPSYPPFIPHTPSSQAFRRDRRADEEERQGRRRSEGHARDADLHAVRQRGGRHHAGPPGRDELAADRATTRRRRCSTSARSRGVVRLHA